MKKLAKLVRTQASRAKAADDAFLSALTEDQHENAQLFAAQWVLMLKSDEAKQRKLEKKADREEAAQRVQHEKISAAERQAEKGFSNFLCFSLLTKHLFFHSSAQVG